ncbi:MAG: T9SS type A sorting domain-containing protein, partial [Flavobacteriales bacterium]
AGATPMTDNMDGTWSYSFSSDTAATYQYKFINGNAWGSDESIPGACAYDGNRQIMVDGAMGDVMSTACYNSCAACGMTTVRFRVDMSNEDVSPFGVHVAGEFQDWDPAATELMDPDGDMVYETVQSFDATGLSEIQFKFINGNTWADPNELIDGACGNESGNRVLTLDSENILLAADATGAAYCYGSCTACVAPLVVTFTADMSVVSSVSPEGVHLAGSFQGWDPAGTPLMDNGDGTWSVSLEVPPGTHEFKFINSNAWDGNEENMEGSGCNNGGNRIATFDDMNNTYTACFNTCPGESCTPDPDPANITFRVNMAEQELTSEQAVFVWGGFTGWQGGAIEMTDADGDGVWEHTENISGGANIDYKYSIGHPNDEGVIEESGVFVMDGDTTNWTLAGCGVDNGFGGFNRRHVRSGMDEVLDVVCFNTCSDCEGSDALVQDLTQALMLFPNPAEGRVVVSGLSGAAHVSIVDAQGRAARVWNNLVLNGQTELSLGGLRAGFYHVVVEQEGARGVQRLVIK